MGELVLKLLGAAISLLDKKEGNKYRDRYLKLKGAWDEEFNKPLAERSDAVLDQLDRELRDLGNSVAAAAGKPDA